MNTVKLNAYAKLNLTLDIVGRENGYHLLDSLVLTIDRFDRIVAKKRKDGLVSVTTHGMGSESIPPERNNALKAGEAFVNRFQTTGADITVYKNIPIGAGLGGSSADAAGIVKALSKLYRVEDEKALSALCVELGSDTAFQFTGGFARMQGRGERVQFFESVPNLHFLVICPKQGVSTAECYALCDKLPKKEPATDAVLNALCGGLQCGARLFDNGLFAAAKALNPSVQTALEEAQSFSPLGAAMTGSGSAVFALFESAELAEWAKSRYRGKFFVFTARSVAPGKEGGLRNPFVLNEEETEG